MAGAAVCAMLAVAYALTGAWIVFSTKMGPIVATLTPTHGVHSGDVVGVAAMVMAGVFTIAAAALAAPSPAPGAGWR